MSDDEFDLAVIGMALSQAEAAGWNSVTVAEAARQAGVPLARARVRFPTRGSLLLRLGLIADQAALDAAPTDGTTREHLFDLVMRRLDTFQRFRGGVCQALRALPGDPGLSLMLMAATWHSMSWMAQVAGIETTGLAGGLRVNGLVAVWMRTVRAWMRDDSADMSGTMAALDQALDRAESLARWLPGAKPEQKPADQSFHGETIPPDV